MRKIKGFDQFVNEDRQQMEIPFDGKHPIHDKPVHVHLMDALDDLAVMPATNYRSDEDLRDMIEQNIESTTARIISGKEEDSVSDLRYDFATENTPWDSPSLWKPSFRRDFNDSDSIGELSDALSTFNIDSMSDVLTKAGVAAWSEHLSAAVNDNVEDMIRYIEQDEDGLIEIWRAVTFTKETDRGSYADVYNAITKGYGGIGVYWSWDEGAAEPHWGTTKDSVYITLHAKVRPEDVDWPETLYKNTYDLKDEREVRIKDNSQVMVIGFEVLNADKGSVGQLKNRKNGTYVALEQPKVVKVGS